MAEVPPIKKNRKKTTAAVVIVSFLQIQVHATLRERHQVEDCDTQKYMEPVRRILKKKAIIIISLRN